MVPAIFVKMITSGLPATRFYPDETVGELGELMVKSALRASADGRRERPDPSAEVLVEKSLSKSHC